MCHTAKSVDMAELGLRGTPLSRSAPGGRGGTGTAGCFCAINSSRTPTGPPNRGRPDPHASPRAAAERARGCNTPRLASSSQRPPVVGRGAQASEPPPCTCPRACMHWAALSDGAHGPHGGASTRGGHDDARAVWPACKQHAVTPLPVSSGRTRPPTRAQDRLRSKTAAGSLSPSPASHRAAAPGRRDTRAPGPHEPAAARSACWQGRARAWTRAAPSQSAPLRSAPQRPGHPQPRACVSVARWRELPHWQASCE